MDPFGRACTKDPPFEPRRFQVLEYDATVLCEKELGLLFSPTAYRKKKLSAILFLSLLTCVRRPTSCSNISSSQVIFNCVVVPVIKYCVK